MLCQLTIRNIALIDSLTVEFGEGFSALTGETGAGKSIVVDAMNLALGERADRELIRSGEDKARVEALFDVTGSQSTLELLREMDIECEDGQIVITRELSASGRNICRVNGSMQPLSALRRLTMTMVDLHGQHAHQSLLDDENHIGYLDSYGADDIKNKLSLVGTAYSEWAKTSRRLRGMSGGTAQRAQRADMLSFQIREIDMMKLRPGEEDTLAAKREMLRNAVKISGALNEALALLTGGEDGYGAVDGLMRSTQLVQSVEQYAPEYARLASALAEAGYAAQDVSADLEAVCYSLGEGDGAEAELDRIEQRLDDIRSLGRKYGGDAQSILKYKEKAERELEELNSSEKTAAELEGKIAQLREELLAKCKELSGARSVWAKKYEEAVVTHLRELGMENACFIIEIESPEDAEADSRFTEEGFDTVRFLFSANAGEPVKPLSRIASGGEMSRVMLALKNVAADYGDVGCLIFDEIDTGISGRMAQVVGEKIARIARGRQVICVTHLPQIACMANEQYLVHKQDEDGRARTFVSPLDEEGRIGEIARLVGGAGGELSAREHASAMLTAAQEVKRRLSG